VVRRQGPFASTPGKCHRPLRCCPDSVSRALYIKPSKYFNHVGRCDPEKLKAGQLDASARLWEPIHAESSWRTAWRGRVAKRPVDFNV